MVGYIRQSTEEIQPSLLIMSSSFNKEFNALASAFGTSGHNHDGTVGNGPKLDINSSTTGTLPSNRVAIDLTGYVKGDESQIFEDGKLVTWHNGELRATTSTYSFFVSGITDLLNERSTTRLIGSGKTVNGFVFSTSSDGRTFDVSTWTADSLRSRTNHTGTQPTSTIAGLDPLLSDLSNRVAGVETLKEDKSVLKALAYKDKVNTGDMDNVFSGSFVFGRYDNNTTGPVVKIPATVEVNGSTVPLRDAGARIQAETPVNPKDVVNKETLDSAMASVVSGPSSSITDGVALFDGTTGKIIKSSGYTVHGTSLAGNTIPLRNANGQFNVGTPTANFHATNKGYVDGIKNSLDSDISSINSSLATKAENTVSIDGVDGLVGGGDLSSNRSIGLSTPTKDSLAKADTAVQPAAMNTALAGKITKANDTGIGGFTSSAKNVGTLSGSVTLSPQDSNFQYGTISGALQLQRPTFAGCYTISLITTNSASTGVVELVGFAKVDGDFDSANGLRHKIIMELNNTVGQSGSHAVIIPLY